MKTEIKEELDTSGLEKEIVTIPSANGDATTNYNSLNTLLSTLQNTITLSSSKVQLPFGYYANVLDLGNDLGLAISTDGVGTKIIIAQMMNKYDTIGIDCIAMNVNDILCVGAKPISMVDYIAVQKQDKKLLNDIGKGLLKGAEISKISIPAGEIAQVEELIKSEKNGYGFDLVGTAVGTLNTKKIIDGRRIEKGDILLGLRSSGIHSNGYTLAREVLFKRYEIHAYLDELGQTLGEELITPTHIYVPEIMEILESGIDVKALAHITSDGFLNLTRSQAECGYEIENLPEPLPIFNLIQETGGILDERMFKIYNMGIGFCLVVPKSDVESVLDIYEKSEIDCYVLGHTTKDEMKTVRIKDKKLEGCKKLNGIPHVFKTY
ncbi:MAG: Phosphoribosylformylglycinamidine cyclo-ligase [Candidatus Scalindua arabica]|uniref:Phosphoribosylformylglycinamidine cyclo-ligase n=1 Tax=Candidatus Scalindua arabica TaxID=1127984 RepID=A0A941W6X8_9BACT|nr:Phosphoribosylformylglycinamidine cyclo-ligase [Candidatus Scalindua arabica]